MSIQTFPAGTLRRCDLGHPVARFNGKLPPRLRSTVKPKRMLPRGVDWLFSGVVAGPLGPHALTPVAGDPRFLSPSPERRT